jgi:hypothetical protein
MKFDGFWVAEKDGKIVIQRSEFDETELDPATGWTQAWQNQDADATAKGFLGAAAAVACAARLIARNQSVTISDAEVTALQDVAPVFQNGYCEIESLAELRDFCIVIKSLSAMHPVDQAVKKVDLPKAVEEIPFN